MWRKTYQLCQAPEEDVAAPPADVSKDDKTTTTTTDDTKAVGGLKFYKEQLEAERKEREKIAQELNDIKTQKLKEQNNWKDLYEQTEKKANEYKEKLSSISTALVQDKMQTAIEKEALALGILPSALEDLDLLDKSMVEVETTSTGKVNFNNVKEFVESIRVKKPHWFGAHQDPNINNKRPGDFKKVDLSAEEILDLQTKDPKKYNELMRQRLQK